MVARFLQRPADPPARVADHDGTDRGGEERHLLHADHRYPGAAVPEQHHPAIAPQPGCAEVPRLLPGTQYVRTRVQLHQLLLGKSGLGPVDREGRRPREQGQPLVGALHI